LTRRSMKCPQCNSTKLELLRYRTGQQTVTLLCARCRREFEADAQALGAALKRMSQSFHEKGRLPGRVPDGRRCRGCGR
jgi:transcription elongation factor Elf1